jgi:hypothetical protein
MFGCINECQHGLHLKFLKNLKILWHKLFEPTSGISELNPFKNEEF